MGSGLPGSLSSYILYYLLLYISSLANKIVVVVVLSATSTTDVNKKAVLSAGRTARYRCKFRHVSKFTAASRGFHFVSKVSMP